VAFTKGDNVMQQLPVNRSGWATGGKSMRHSVVRRSLYVSLFYVTGHAFYYLLILVANSRLEPVDFGRFYLGWAILNIIAAPGAVLTLALSGYFAEVHRLHGPAKVVSGLRAALTTLFPWLLAIMAAVELILFFTGLALGSDAVIMIALLPLTALSSVLVDTVRAVFQGALQFVWFGASWLLWCASQFVFGAIFLLLTGAPWAVFLGMLAANCLALVCVLVAVWRLGADAARRGGGPAAKSEFATQSLRHILPFCTALGALVLLNYVDVFVAYLKLSGAELGVYAASAVLPKAIVTATQPVTQVILPLATHMRGQNLKTREVLLKAIGMTFAVAALGASALWLVSGKVCGSPYGIKFCNPSIMLLLASAAVAVAVTRTAIVADLLGGRYWRPHLPIAALVLLAAAIWFGRVSGTELAMRYAIVGWLLLCIMVALKFLDWHRAGNPPLLKRTAK
jgi:O-antigen/teichoic acid export membrane protein